MMMSVQDFAQQYITVWEDGGSSAPAHILSTDAQDPGNWTGGVCGKGVCCGSQHGVTAQALARYRDCPVDRITEDAMRALTVEEAARIAIQDYYRKPGLDRLPWDPVIASVVDFGWNAGPHEAVSILQRLVGVPADGAIGAQTADAYRQWIAAHGVEGAATLWAGTRDAFYQMLVRKRPVDGKFLNGWMRRTAYYRPGTPWWVRFGAAS